MATAAAAARKADVKEFNFTWVGTDKAEQDRARRDARERRSAGQRHAAPPGHQGRRGQEAADAAAAAAITEKDITLFTRQLATMMKSGVPLLQAFDIVGKGHSNPAVARLLLDIKTDVETGSSLEAGVREAPAVLRRAVLQPGRRRASRPVFSTRLLDRLATYKEKILAIKSKIKSALFYPIAIIVVAFVITAVIMIFVIPAFKQVFTSFGADLPGPTLIVMAISDFFVEYWYVDLRRHRRRASTASSGPGSAR